MSGDPVVGGSEGCGQYKGGSILVESFYFPYFYFLGLKTALSQGIRCGAPGALGGSEFRRVVVTGVLDGEL